MTDYNRILNYFKSWVGYLEKDNLTHIGESMENPENYSKNSGDGNYTIFAKDFYRSTGINVQGQPWCDTFIDICFIKVFGLEKAKKMLGGFSAYTPDSANFFSKQGRFSQNPQNGSIVFFKGSRIHHTGFIVNYDNTYIYTIEGNTSNDDKFNRNGGCVAMKRHLRNASNIAGYGVINYMINGWNKEGNNWRYYQNGEIITNKNILSNGLSYYVDNSGLMVRGQNFINGERRVFCADGRYDGAELKINDVEGVQVL